jgi:DNA replication protein DnaD
MAKQGWISVHRQLQDHWLWQDKPYTKGQAWIDLLLSASHCDSKVMFDCGVIEVKKGSFITSISKLERRWGWSNRKVTKFLDMLQADRMIERKSTKRYTTITIENYTFYQNDGRTDAPLEHHSSTTDAPFKHTINNSNNENNSNKPINNVQIEANNLFETLWKLYPNKKGKGQVSDTQKRKIAKVGYDEMARAIERYQKDLKKDADWRKPQNGSTFFNSGYEDYLDVNYQSTGTYQTKEQQDKHDRTYVDLSGIL